MIGRSSWHLPTFELLTHVVLNDGTKNETPSTKSGGGCLLVFGPAGWFQKACSDVDDAIF
jgi:hypothetical protein